MIMRMGLLMVTRRVRLCFILRKVSRLITISGDWERIPKGFFFIIVWFKSFSHTLHQLSKNFTCLQLCHGPMLTMTLSMESRVWSDLLGQGMTWKMMMWMMLRMSRICFDTWMSFVIDWTQFHPVWSQKLDWKENPSFQVHSLKTLKKIRSSHKH